MQEIYGTLIGNIPTAIAVAIIIGLIRNVTGWLENALKDNKIDSYEWKQLVGTISKYFCYVMVLMIGLPLDKSIIIAFALDVLKSTLDKMKQQPITNTQQPTVTVNTQ